MPNPSQRPVWRKRLVSFVIYGVLFIGLISAVDWWRSGDVAKQVPRHLLNLQALDGTTYDLAALSTDKPVIVYFWGTWCPVCPTTSPTVDWFSDRYSVLSVAMSSGSPKQVQRYLTNNDYQFATVNDPRNAIAQQWGVQVTPTIAIIINQQVVSVTTGVTTPVGLQLRIWLNQLLH